jgi:hypothetical protein
MDVITLDTQNRMYGLLTNRAAATWRPWNCTYEKTVLDKIELQELQKINDFIELEIKANVGDRRISRR